MGHLTLLLALTVPGVALAQGRTAVIDSASVLQQCAEGKQALAAHRKGLEPALAEIKRMEQKLNKAIEALRIDTAKGKGNEAELSDRREKLVADQRYLTEKAAAFQQLSEEGERKALEPVRRRLAETLKGIAAREGYELVVERSAAPYVRPDLDITERVITMMDTTK